MIYIIYIILSSSSSQSWSQLAAQNNTSAISTTFIIIRVIIRTHHTINSYHHHHHHDHHYPHRPCHQHHHVRFINAILIRILCTIHIICIHHLILAFIIFIMIRSSSTCFVATLQHIFAASLMERKNSASKMFFSCNAPEPTVIAFCAISSFLLFCDATPNSCLFQLRRSFFFLCFPENVWLFVISLWPLRCYGLYCSVWLLLRLFSDDQLEAFRHSFCVLQSLKIDKRNPSRQN